MTLSRLVVRLVLDDLLQTLNVAIDAALHVVIGLLPAGRFEDRARRATSWFRKIAVRVGESCQARSRDGGSEEMHCWCWFMVYGFCSVVMV